MPLSSSPSPWTQTIRALSRARFGIVTIAAAHVVSILAGILMVSSGNSFALRRRDSLVAHANNTSRILRALNSNHLKTAATLDFGGNLAGGTASLLAGYWAPATYPIVLYRGWIGGIVSVNGKHRSRFSSSPEAAYYLTTLLLQLIPYSLVGGAGVMIGLARARPVGIYAGPKLLSIPTVALRDAARIYVPRPSPFRHRLRLRIPLFALNDSLLHAPECLTKGISQISTV